MTFVTATYNAEKLKGFKRILEPLGFDAVIREDLSEVEETDIIFAEDILLKAGSACEVTGMLAITDGSGPMVDAFGDAPGVYPVRYAGESTTDRQRYEKLLEGLHEVPTKQHTARFASVVCRVFPDGKVLTVEDACEGIIALRPKGKGDSGYDPTFLAGERPYTETTAEERDSASHRGRMLAKLTQELENWKESG